jgi:hypothetical protein
MGSYGNDALTLKKKYYHPDKTKKKHYIKQKTLYKKMVYIETKTPWRRSEEK